MNADAPQLARAAESGPDAPSCSPSFLSYADFHTKRLEKLEAFVAKKKASMIKRGWNDSGPVEWECRWRGLKEIKGFKEREVWEAAWKACLANVERIRADQKL